MLAVVGLLATATAASAQAGGETEADLFVAEDALDGRVELSIADLEQVFGRSFGETDPEIKAELARSSAEIQAYTADFLTIGAGGETWEISFADVELFRERDDLAFAVVPYEVDVDGQSVPVELDIRFDPFFDDVGDRDGLLLLTGGWTAGAFDADAEALVTFTDNSRQQSVDLGDRTHWQTFTSGITLGIDHIRTGPDHIMFVLALLLPSVLVFSGGWKPMPSFGGALWRVLKIATFFTLAHSITFTLAGMGLLPLPPSKLIESVIALSIAAAALHNLRPVLPNREWALSFVFGLFHGMGFASLIASLDVSRTSQLVSLLGRNVGIEIGQVVVILVAFPALFLFRRTSWYQPILTIGSIVLAALSMSWMMERLFELDLGTYSIVDSLVDVPRGYVIAAALTVVAFAVQSRESRRGDLQAVHDDDGVAEPRRGWLEDGIKS